nr:MAG TPA: hypothetical protein [Herelleviridae sp.]
MPAKTTSNALQRQTYAFSSVAVPHRYSVRRPIYTGMER